MKRLNYRWILLSLICCFLCSFAASANSAPAAKQFVPDKRFATINDLAEFMTNGLRETNTIDEMMKRHEEQSQAIKSYWTFNHKGSKQAKMTETVLKDLNKLADRLSEGSTIDMVQSGCIEAAISNYRMAKDYSMRSQSNPLYTDEMQDWLALESELNNFGSDLAYLNNWGGSLARIISSGFVMTTANDRQRSYGQLRRGGQFDNSQVQLQDALSRFNQAASMTFEPDEYMMEESGYEATIADMQQCGKRLQELFDKWLDSHLKLCKSEGIPESHTAAFVQSLTDNILGMTEH